MKNKNRILAIIISCIYAVTLVAYVVFLISSYRVGQKKAESTFAALNKVTGTILSTTDPCTQKFVDTVSASTELRDSFKTYDNLVGMQMAIGDNLVYSNPGDLSKSPAARSALVRIYTTTQNSLSGAAVSITYAIYLLTPQTIYNGGKVAFIVILVFTVICAFFILFSYWSSYEDSEHSAEKSLQRSLQRQAEESNSSGVSTTQDEVNSQLDQISGWTAKKQEDIQYNAQEQSSESTVENQETVIMEYKDDRPERDELFSTQDIEDVTSTFYDDEPAKDEEFAYQDDSSDSQDNSTVHNESTILSFEDVSENKEEASFVSSPSGLFSPESGFGWESYLNTRLSSELVRAASQESDLSLLSIRIPDLKKGTISAKAIYSLILDMVKFQDLVFEKGTDGCIAIFQDTTIDQAITIADRLHGRIVEILSANNLSTVCGFGISSKSLRLISAERLIMEAEQAMNYALEDTSSPIVAYRVNPEKYRNYLNTDSN